MGNILVTAKVNPDLDGVACSLAYAHLLGPDAYGGVFGEPLPETDFFIKEHNFSIRILDSSETLGWDKFILVDASQFEGLPKAVSKENVIEVIDHRDGTVPKEDFPNATVQIELVGAAASLIVERYVKAEKLPTKEDAALLYGAIHHNTLDLLTSNVTQKDKDAVSFLQEKFGLTHKMAEEMFEYQTKKIIGDVKRVIYGDGKVFDVDGEKYGFCQLEFWGDSPKRLEKEIDTNLADYFLENNCGWGFLSILDIQNRKNMFYAPNPKAQEILRKLFSVEFLGKWGEMSPMLLRKQIFPKINESLLSK